jgi:hypothetical protein
MPMHSRRCRRRLLLASSGWTFANCKQNETDLIADKISEKLRNHKYCDFSSDFH